MRLLLDTQALLGALGAPDELGAEARTALGSWDNQVFVSAVSAFEIATKHRIHKLPRAASLLPVYAEMTGRLGIELGISTHHALEAGRLDWEHKDPFDRLLAAQAMTEQLTLVTGDEAFDRLPGLSTIW